MAMEMNTQQEPSTRFRRGARRRDIRAIRRVLAVLVVAFGALGVMAGTLFATERSEPASGPTPWPGGNWQPGPAQYGVMEATNVRIPTDDPSVTLSAHIGYPTDLATGARAAG